MKCLLDTNVLIDYLCQREPFFKDARLLMALGAVGEVELWISSSQITDLIYVLTDGGKPSLAEKAKESLRKICSFVRICGVGEAQVHALFDSPWTDLEDALVHEAARKCCADYLITRNQEDFRLSSVPVMSPADWFGFMEEKNGISYVEMALSR